MDAYGTKSACGAASAAPKNTAVGSLYEAVDRLEKVEGILHETALRLTGGWPTPACKDASEPYPGGIFGEIEALADRVQRAVDRFVEAGEAVARRI